jgi:hypothetical protein
MIFRKINALTLAGAAFICMSSEALLAGTFGPFTYSVEGESITITDCSATGNITVPATIEGKQVKAIGAYAFGFNKITGITLPEGISSIGEYAFFRCTALTTVTIPEGVQTIGDYAFYFCGNLDSVTIPGSVTEYHSSIFRACDKLRSVVLGEGITSIPAELFAEKRKFESVSIPSSVTEIGDNAFLGCKQLTSIVLPANLRTLGKSAVAGTGITRLVIPESVENIGQSLFKGCQRLERVVLPENLDEIGDEMFSGCIKLTSPTLPAKVKRIGKNAFYYTGLATISIPSSVKTIDSAAFGECDNLVSVRLEGDAPTLGKKVFDGAPDFCVFIENDKKGYTVPKWNGYLISLPRPEIAVTAGKGSFASGASAKFGNVLIGNKSVVKRFTIRNVGSRDLTKIGAKIKGGSSKDYQITLVSKSTLSPGKSGYVDVLFSPRKKGTSISELRIKSNDKDESPFEVGLRGIGLQGLN